MGCNCEWCSDPELNAARARLRRLDAEAERARAPAERRRVAARLAASLRSPRWQDHAARLEVRYPLRWGRHA